MIKVIIVNFNGGELLLKCIGSVLAAVGNLRIEVIDNASTDRSDEIARSRFGQADNLEILSNQQNLGFARAVNSSARSGHEPYLLILNPDCIVEPNALKELQLALEADPGAALAGPCVTGVDGKVQKSALRRFPTTWRSLMTITGLFRFAGRASLFGGIEQELPDNNVVADAVSGACMLVRRKHFREAGGFDEDYSMHCEDLDLMVRLRQLGHHCIFVPSARVRHEKGHSSRSRPWWVHRHKHLGMQRFYRKFQGQNHFLPMRWLVYAGIWGHYLLTLPRLLFSR
jgi:GT2 family glycosyltransferase